MSSKAQLIAIILLAATVGAGCGRTQQPGAPDSDEAGFTATAPRGGTGADGRPAVDSAGSPAGRGGSEPPVAGGGGGAAGSGGVGGMGGASGVCSSDGWCCDSGGNCCNDDLGICTGQPVPGLPVAGAGGGAPIPIPVPSIPPRPSGGVPGRDLGDCESQSVSGGQGYCETQFSCDNGYLNTHCYDEGDGWYCGCDRGDSYIDYRLVDASTSAGPCNAIAELCRAGAPADSDVACVRPYVEQGANHCVLEDQCTRSFPVPGGGTAEVFEYRHTYCESGGGTWLCECNAGNRHSRIELMGERDSPDVCQEVLDLCSEGAIESSGPAECVQRFQAADRNYCDTELECAQAGTLRGEAVRVFNYRHAHCERGSGDGWECYCDGGTDGGGAHHSLEGEDGWSVCSQVSALCAN